MKNNIQISYDFNTLSDLLEGRKVVVVADDCFKSSASVCPAFESWLDSRDFPILWVHASEEEKTLATVERLVGELLELGADRDAFLLGAGGGITTDITGFTASIYKRGVKFGFVPTTLLAQVDASLGGKNGVNFDHLKNMVGVIRQPEFVFVNPVFISSLPQRLLSCGFAEMLKTFLIGDGDLFPLAVAQWDTNQEKFIRRAIEIKCSVVEQDEYEGGLRRVLNLGHTFAHAIEKCSDRYLHGEAVAIGTVIAASISASLEILPWEEVAKIRETFLSAGLPVVVDGISFDDMEQAIAQDKKMSDDGINFVLPVSIGKVTIKKLSIEELRDGYSVL